MILCLGTKGSGKSCLLRELQIQDIKREKESSTSSSSSTSSTVNKTVTIPANTTPTVGTNLITLTPPNQGRKPGLSGGGSLNQDGSAEPDVSIVREVGGSMAPLWHSYIEPGKTKGVLYVVDSSSPETVGAATIHLVELLHRPGLETAQVMVVFTKTDLPSARSLGEIMSIMRLGQIAAASKQIVRHVSFSCKGEAINNNHHHHSKVNKDKENIAGIYDWCTMFAMPRQKQ